MVKPEWGTKRHCQSCAAAFYDLNRAPILCPKCKAEFDPEAHLRSRRGRAGSSNKDGDSVALVDDKSLSGELVAAGIDPDQLVVADADDDPDMIEDASELGEDEDDMVGVIEKLDDHEER
ncbi:MAG: TIGR02300 family protein [Alphaproteobacteria bacterium]|nr:TIGR02300 family protein [Alphaproteobacteria bacterium]